jgi:hypothetical protein
MSKQLRGIRTRHQRPCTSNANSTARCTCTASYETVASIRGKIQRRTAPSRSMAIAERRVDPCELIDESFRGRAAALCLLDTSRRSARSATRTRRASSPRRPRRTGSASVAGSTLGRHRFAVDRRLVDERTDDRPQGTFSCRAGVIGAAPKRQTSRRIAASTTSSASSAPSEAPFSKSPSPPSSFVRCARQRTLAPVASAYA